MIESGSWVIGKLFGSFIILLGYVHVMLTSKGGDTFLNVEGSSGRRRGYCGA